MTILLVEDDAMLAHAIRERARQEGFALDHASDADGARLALLDNAYSVILLDLGLPGESGLSLLRSLLRDRRRPDGQGLRGARMFSCGEARNAYK